MFPFVLGRSYAFSKSTIAKYNLLFSRRMSNRAGGIVYRNNINKSDMIGYYGTDSINMYVENNINKSNFRGLLQINMLQII